MAKRLPISEVKARLPELVADLQKRRKRAREIVITCDGKPSAVLLSFKDFRGYKSTIEVLSDPDLMQQIRESEEFFASGKRGLSFEEVFGEPLEPPKRRAR